MIKSMLSSLNSKKNKNLYFSKFLLLALLGLGLISNSLNAQYSGTISIPNARFANLRVLIDSLNAYGLSGALTVNFTVSQTAPLRGYQLGSTALNATMSSTKTLTFNGGTLTAYTGGTRTGAVIAEGISTTFGSGDAIFVVKGTDHVTFNNMTFNENATNTANTSGMEHAIAFHNLNGTGTMDGCQKIRIIGCIFNMMDFASSNQYVIYATSTLYGGTANLIWSVESDLHRDFTIDNCTFNNGMSHALFKGSLEDFNSTYTGAGTVRNINIRNSNFRRIGGNNVQHAGVILYGVDTFDIANNIFDIDSMHSVQISAIFNQNCGGFGRIYNNEITIKRSASATNTIIGINNEMNGFIGEDRPSTTTSLVRKNLFKVGYHNPSVVLTNSVNANIMIFAGAEAEDGNDIELPSTCIIDSNSMVGNTFRGRGTIDFIRTHPYILHQKVIVKDNVFRNVFRNGISGNINAIVVENNYENEIYNNIINNIRVVPAATPTTALPATIDGIISSNDLPEGYGKVYNNTISDLFINAPSTSTGNYIRGMTVSGYSDTVFNNKIHDLHVALQSSGGGTITGMSFPIKEDQGTLNAFNNVVDSLIFRNNGTTMPIAVVEGASLTGTGIVNFFNNFIGELYSPNSSNVNAVIGFNSPNSTGSVYLTNNTIQFGRLGAITSSSTTSFGGSGFSFSIGDNNILKNNIINIKGIPGVTGGSFAVVRRVVTGTAGTKPANFSGNNNTYSVNTNSNNYIYAEGIVAATLVNAHYVNSNSSATNPVGNFETQASFNSACGLYKTFMKGEANTFNEDVLATAHGTVANVFTPSGATLSESSGEVLATTSTDLTGSARGANYDRGAMQFSGSGIDLMGPAISFTPRGNINCTNVPVRINAVITDFTGVSTTTGTRPRLYYRKTTDPDTFVSANTSAAPGWKWVQASNTSSPFTFTYDWTKFAVAPVINDTITYFFAAQDIVGTTNISTNAVTLVPITSCPSSVNIGATAGLTNATSPYRFKVDSTPKISFDVAKNPICNGSANTIKANQTLVGAAVVGTSTTSGSSIGESPFMGGWGGTKSQYIIRSSELQAFGLTAGKINSIELFPRTSGTTYEGFQIWMGNTSQADLSSAFIDTSAMTKVYEATAAAAAYTPVAGSWNAFSIGTTPAAPLGSAVSPTFVWDGTSNLVICFSWSENPVAFTSTASNCEFHATTFVAARSNRADGLTMAQMLGDNSNNVASANFRPNFRIIGNRGPSVNPTTGYTWSPSGLGTAQTIFPFPSTSPITKYKVTVTDLNGCIYRDSVSINVDTLPKRLRVFNATTCGAGVPPKSFKVRDSNGYASPTINWYASMAATSPLQSSIDTIFLSTVASTTTFFVSVQSLAGCWSPRVPITLTVLTSDSIVGRANGTRDTIRVCSGMPINLTALNVQLPVKATSYDTFTWTSNHPNSGIGSPIKTTNGNHTFAPIVGGNYQLYVNAIDTGSYCSAVDTIKLSVQTNPFGGAAVKQIISVPNPVCIGGNVTHTFILSQPASALPTGYCASAADQDEDEEIDSVKFLVISNSTGCGGSTVGGTLTGTQGTATGTASWYSNFTTSTVPIPDLIPGFTYPITIKIGSYDGSCAATNFLNSAKVFFDWNRDGDFADANEQSQFFNNLDGTQTKTINITVPANASIGKTLMRISSRETSAAAITPCQNGGFGETEDYTVNIMGAPAGTGFQWTSNQTGATVLGTANPLVHSLPAPTTVYTLKLTNGVCIDSAKDTVTNSVAAFATTPIAGPSSVCMGGDQLSLRLSTKTTGGCIPYTYNWFIIGGGGAFTPVGSLNNDTILFNPTGATGIRTVRVVVTNSSGGRDSSTHVISYNNPRPTAIVDDTVCGIQPGILNATASPATDILRWYASPTSYKPLGQGSSYTTPPVNATTKFYVRQFTSVMDSAGDLGADIDSNATIPQGLRMNVNQRLIINSADIFPFGPPNSSGTISVELRDNFGVTLTSLDSIPFSYNTGGAAATTAATATPVTIPLGFLIDPDNGYELVVTDVTGDANFVHRDYVFPSPYPMNSTTGSFSIMGGIDASGFTDLKHNYLFNLKSEQGCWGDPVEDSVRFVTPPTLTLSRRYDSVCSGGSTTPLGFASPVSNYNTYTWTPSTNISGTIGTGYTFSEPIPGDYTYILAGTQTSGLQCTNIDTFLLKVKEIPEPILTIPAASVNICNGNIQSIVAKSENIVNGGKIGSGTTGTWGETVGPFNPLFEDQRTQHLILASEMTAMGFKAGILDSVQYTIMSNLSSGTFDITYKMAHTDVTSLTGYVTPNSWTTCYTNATYPNPDTFVPVTITFPFSAPFYWNGVSNIVIEMCQNNTAYTDDIEWEATTTAFESTYGTFDDNQTVTCATNSYLTSNTPRANPTFYQNAKYPITWSPNTNLFTNAGVTTSYTSGARDTVWSRHNDTIKYFMTATHSNGCSIKDSITLNVKDTITINQQPVAFRAFCIGDTIKLIVNASSTSPITYQWKKNGVNISTALNTSAGTNQLIIPNASQLDSGTYEVDMTTGIPCGTKTSIASAVEVRLPITITTQPKDITVCLGAPFALNAAASNDSSRSWTQIGGMNTAATNTFSVTASAYSDSGRYFITYIPRTPCAVKRSDTVRVRLLPAAQILTDPATLTSLCIGDSVILRPTHIAALGFQWLKNGFPISGATNDSLRVRANALADSGEYRLVVYSPIGCINDTSTVNTGVIKINLPVSITTQPLAKTFVCQNSPFNASVTASNTSGYQWEKNAVTIFAATNSSLTINGIQPSDVGVFRVLVKGIAPCPNVYSTNDTLVVTTLAAITTPPSSFTVCQDQSISISGAASNASGYQWLFNGTNLSAINPYTKAMATISDSGMYRLVALSNSAGATVCKADTSVAILGKVVRKILVNSQPPLLSLGCVNANLSMNVVAQNVVSYNWNLNGNPISQTTATMSRTPFTLADTGVYTVVMTGNSPCPSVTSTDAKLERTTKAVIMTMPASTDVCIGNSLTLNAVAMAQESFQWRKNGVNIPGNTGSIFSIPVVGLSDAATYDVIAVAFAGCTNDTSIGAAVSVKTPLVNTSPLPKTDVKCEGQNISFTAGASGDGPLTYLWTLNGSSIGASSANYAKAGVLVSDSGRYIVNIQGSMACPVLRDTIDIDVNKAPVILSQPNGASPICLGSNVVLTTEVANQSTLEWHKQGIGNLGQSGNTYTSVSSVAADSGNYFIIVKALPACSDLTSNTVNVQINIPASILKQPQGKNLLEGQSYTMSVSVSGTGPFSYKWFKNGVIIPNALDSSYAIASYTAIVDSGQYHVEITSPAPCGNNVVSNKARIATLDTSSSISSINANGFGFSLYPVPTKDGKVIVDVSSKKLKPITFTVTDMTGRTVAVFNEKHLSLESSHVFDFSQLANGNYQLMILNDEEFAVGRFSISK